MATNTSNMNLIVPTIGTDSGLVWEQSVNANTTVIDQHDHTPGSGVQIPPSGLNINTALPFNNQSATGVKSVQLTVQTSLATALNLYAQGSDLYFNDASGNVVRITSGGLVNATSSGISSGTASAAFVASVLVVNADTNKPANIQAGSILIGNNTTNSKFLTLAPPNAMAANYGLTLPALPAATKIMACDSSGNITASVDADNATLQYSGNTLAVKALGIQTANIAAAAVTQDKVSATNYVIGSTCGSFTTTSTTFVDVTSLNVTITSTGRPLVLALIADGTTSNAGYIYAAMTSGAQCGSVITINEGASILTSYDSVATNAPASFSTRVPVGCINHFLIPSVGAHTYKIQMKSAMVTGSVGIIDAKLIAYEII